MARFQTAVASRPEVFWGKKNANPCEQHGAFVWAFVVEPLAALGKGWQFVTVGSDRLRAASRVDTEPVGFTAVPSFGPPLSVCSVSASEKKN